MSKIVHNSDVPIFTPSSSDVKTTLIHRLQRGQIPWWRRATVCTIAETLDEKRMSCIAEQAINIARTGYTAVEIQQELSKDPASDSHELQAFIAKIHRTGVKVIVRISHRAISHPTNDPANSFRDASSRFVVQAREALKGGADGIDLGSIEDSSHCGDDHHWRGHGIGVPMSVERFSQFVRILQSELADFDAERILCAETTIQPRIALQYHLEEDWFHHLRDNSLTEPVWDGKRIRENVFSNISLRAPLGNVSAWSWKDTSNSDNDGHHGDGNDSHATSCTSPATSCDRESALALYTLSLPGSIYVPCKHDTLAHVSKTDYPIASPMEDDTTQKQLHVLTSAIRIRDERRMASGALAFVDNLKWTHPGVVVQLSAGVLVVLNTSREVVQVPGEYRLLIDSQATIESEPGLTVVPPNSAAWFDSNNAISE